jgi:hypothetical protein
MKKTAIKFLALGIFLAACRIASAATHTISWSPATTYTDGTAISGATVTYSLYWSTSSSLSSVNTIATGLTGTSYVFDPSALGMSAGSTVYFAMKTALSTGAVSGYSTALSWSVPAKTLSGISIGGASSVNEGATSTYTATATWSDGSTTAVTPTWSLSSTSYASISGSGVLTAASVTSNQTVTVNASYTSGGVTKTAAKSVTVANVAATLSGISINGASSVNEGATSAYTATATWSDGSTTAVTPTWSLSSTSYASISGSGVLTAASVTSNQTVTVNASYTSGGITKTATKSVTIANVAAALTGITISGAASVNEGGTALYSATASWSDGTTTAVSPTWSLAGTAYAAINSVGVLTAGSVSADQTVTVNASFTAGGATRTASRAVVVVNVEQPDPASARHLRISKPDTLPQDTWRLSWDAVTTYANGEELAAGAAVLYNVYWSRDPSLAADNLVLLTTATTATHVDFPPLSQGMVQQERVYFTLRTILGSGNPSALSEPLPWRVLNRSPVAPAKGKIGLKTIVSRN